jgi:hypothetical protein
VCLPDGSAGVRSLSTRVPFTFSVLVTSPLNDANGKNEIG